MYVASQTTPVYEPSLRFSFFCVFFVSKGNLFDFL